MATEITLLPFDESGNDIWVESIDSVQHVCINLELGTHGVTFDHVDSGSNLRRVFMPWSFVRAVHQVL